MIFILRIYKYTDKEKKELLKSLVILVDTREKKANHITDWFDKYDIKYKRKTLNNGDYSFYVPQNAKLNIGRDLYFDHEIFIERKANLEELSSNFTKHRARFKEEMATSNAKKYLLIENADYQDIINKNYNTDFSPKSYIASLHSFNHRYGLEFFFIPNEKCTAYYIYNTFKYYLSYLLR